MAQLLRKVVVPLRSAASELDAIVELAGEAKFVLIGESTHGSEDFYRSRAEITRRLIETKGFQSVAVEADWPDAYRANTYVMGRGNDKSAKEALEDFVRFPMWMWRNTVVEEFVEWLRKFNSGKDDRSRCGFYGLDLYSLHKSMQCVIQYLDKTDPKLAKKARDRYACFNRFGEDAQSYGMMTGMGAGSCESEVIEQLLEMNKRAIELIRNKNPESAETFFTAFQNAEVVKSAERYYRMMYFGTESTWNIRDKHMVQTTSQLQQFLSEKNKSDVRMVIWEHNSHVGDARATESRRSREINVGQLMREKFGDDTFIIGYTTYSGTVTAAEEWDEPAMRRKIVPGIDGSYEKLFHEVEIPQFMIATTPRGIDLLCDGNETKKRDMKAAVQELQKPLLERAIGVVYKPRTERQSHYFRANIAKQFDLIIHMDQTKALTPLDKVSCWETGEEETYPSGL